MFSFRTAAIYFGYIYSLPTVRFAMSVSPGHTITLSDFLIFLFSSQTVTSSWEILRGAVDTLLSTAPMAFVS